MHECTKLLSPASGCCNICSCQHFVNTTNAVFENNFWHLHSLQYGASGFCLSWRQNNKKWHPHIKLCKCLASKNFVVNTRMFMICRIFHATWHLLPSFGIKTRLSAVFKYENTWCCVEELSLSTYLPIYLIWLLQNKITAIILKKETFIHGT